MQNNELIIAFFPFSAAHVALLTLLIGTHREQSACLRVREYEIAMKTVNYEKSAFIII